MHLSDKIWVPAGRVHRCMQPPSTRCSRVAKSQCDDVLSTVFLFKNCPGQRNRELPWAIFALKLALAIFALGFFEFSSGLETLADRSGSKNAFERDRNQLRRLILRPVHGTFTFSPNSAKIADPQKMKKYPGQFLH